jgi:hypothetical protein
MAHLPWTVKMVFGELVPRHRGFDWLVGHFQDRQVLGRHQHLDAAWRPGLAANEACPFEGQNDLMDGRGVTPKRAGCRLRRAAAG